MLKSQPPRLTRPSAKRATRDLICLEAGVEYSPRRFRRLLRALNGRQVRRPTARVQVVDQGSHLLINTPVMEFNQIVTQGVSP